MDGPTGRDPEKLAHESPCYEEGGEGFVADGGQELFLGRAREVMSREVDGRLPRAPQELLRVAGQQVEHAHPAAVVKQLER